MTSFTTIHFLYGTVITLLCFKTPIAAIYYIKRTGFILTFEGYLVCLRKAIAVPSFLRYLFYRRTSGSNCSLKGTLLCSHSFMMTCVNLTRVNAAINCHGDVLYLHAIVKTLL